MTIGGVNLALSGAGVLVMQCMKKAEVPTVFFAPTFTSKTVLWQSQAPGMRRKVCSKEGLEIGLDQN